MAGQSGAIRLRSDAIRKHLAGLPLHEKGGDNIYTPAMSNRTYTRLIELGAQLAQSGYRVILDAKFDRQAKRQEAIASAQAAGIPMTFIYCTAPKDVLKARVTGRKGDIADATAAILAKQVMEPFALSTPVMTIDTTQPEASIQQQLASVFEHSTEVKADG